MLNKLICYIILSLSIFSANAGCSSDNALANYAYKIATADGHKHPKLVIGMLKVESTLATAPNYRVVKHANSTFYGASQLTIGAAREVMRRFPDLWNGFNTRTDEELKARLILDDRFNIAVGSKYLLIMGVNKNPARGVAAYNVGPGGVELINYQEHEYTQKVMRAASKEC